jgi:hypothetical protein
VEIVELTKLLGVILDWKLSWSKHIDITVAKMGRSISIIKVLLYLLNSTINKAVPTGPSCRTWTTFQSCGQVPQKGLRKIAIGSEQVSPCMYTES